jgi:hypothetical protein
MINLSQAQSNYVEAYSEAKLYLDKLYAAPRSSGQQAAINVISNLLKSSDDLIIIHRTYNINNVSMFNPDYERFYSHFKKYFKSKNLNQFTIK